MYLGNTNVLFALTSVPDVGTIRETFFLRTMSVQEAVYSSNVSDFTIGRTPSKPVAKREAKSRLRASLCWKYLPSPDIRTK